MKVVDRTVAPPLRDIERIELPPVEPLQLANGAQVWRISAGTQEVIKLEFLFDAGRWQEPQRAVAATTVKMLMEGTTSRSAQQLAEEFEYYGANINTDAAIDYATITLFCLTKHLPNLLPLLHEMIYEAVIPDAELDTHIRNNKQRLKVNLEKVDFLAHREFNLRLFGANHPNGYTTSAEDYDALSAQTLRQFHQSGYVYGRFRLIASGKVTDDHLKMLDDSFGKRVIPASNDAHASHTVETAPGRQFFVERKDSVQSAIRTGKILVNKTHPDFPGLRVLNTVLGGYFGSRLMQNLREDKGYCYGIHSGIASYVNTACFFVSAEVGHHVTAAALKEIYREIDRLRNEPVPVEELMIVRNYMLGVLLGDADGPLNVSEIIRGLIVFGLDTEYFDRLVSETRTTTSEELLRLAQKYLDPASLIEAVAGSK